MTPVKSITPALGLLSALTFSALSSSAMGAVLTDAVLTWDCEGNCGTAVADGVVTAPPGGAEYRYVTSSGATTGLGFGLGDEQNGSRALLSFSAQAGDRLEYAFNYVTTDGGDFTDYAWARLLDGALTPVAMLFTARTAASGDSVPGYALPTIDPGVIQTPSTAAIIPGAPTWSPLGGWSGTCSDVGCGYTGWNAMSYTFSSAGSYVLEVGVVNWSDNNYDSGLAFSGTLVPVPEPETYAMMLAGLGLLACVAHRRKAGA